MLEGDLFLASHSLRRKQSGQCIERIDRFCVPRW